jgi:uncharacterized protein with ParB-like and HNH nuclease domain
MKTKLKLSDVRKSLSFRTQNTSLHYLSALADNRYGYLVDFDVYLPSKGKNLQRDFVWTIEQKQELIFSILKNIKIAPLALIQHEDEKGVRTIKVIDGKQRLSTMFSFYRNEFPIVVNGESYFYNDLEETAQKEISMYRVQGDIAYEYFDAMISDDEKIKWFEMINFFGTPQDKSHLENLKS